MSGVTRTELTTFQKIEFAASTVARQELGVKTITVVALQVMVPDALRPIKSELLHFV